MTDGHVEGKVTLYHKTTGEAREYWPIDAAQIVAADDSEWGYTQSSAAAGSTAESTDASDDAAEDFDAMTKEQLVDLATAAELTVKRGDGEDGEPLKADYVKALKRAARKKAG